MDGAAAPLHDALALVELDSIARGYKVVDALVKKAPVHLLEVNLVEPGKCLILCRRCRVGERGICLCLGGSRGALLGCHEPVQGS